MEKLMFSIQKCASLNVGNENKAYINYHWLYLYVHLRSVKQSTNLTLGIAECVNAC